MSTGYPRDPHPTRRTACRILVLPHDPEEDALRDALCQDINDLIAGAKHGVGRVDIDRVAERYFPDGKPRAKEFRDALAGEIEELVEEARR